MNMSTTMLSKPRSERTRTSTVMSNTTTISPTTTPTKIRAQTQLQSPTSPIMISQFKDDSLVTTPLLKDVDTDINMDRLIDPKANSQYPLFKVCLFPLNHYDVILTLLTQFILL